MSGAAKRHIGLPLFDGDRHMAISKLSAQRGYVTLTELLVATALTSAVVLGIGMMQTASVSFLNQTSAHTGFQSYLLVEKMSRWIEIGSEIDSGSVAADRFAVRLDYDDNTGQDTTTAVRNFSPKNTTTEDDDMWLAVRLFAGQGIFYIKQYNSPGSTAPPIGFTWNPGDAGVIPLTGDSINAKVLSCNFSLTNPSTTGDSTVLNMRLTVNGTPNRVIQQQVVLGVSTK